ncbi:MAG: ABC transporter substrate-binding protein [Rhodospirillales bacterium]
MGLGSSNAKASQPVRGGHVRYGVRDGYVSDTLDPSTFKNSFIRTMGYGVYNTLVEIDGNNQLQPELLESFAAEPGAKTWLFKLRPGITFHNGKPLTSADVAATIQLHLGPDSKSGVKALLSVIDRMIAEDDLTLRFELNSGLADFPYVFSDYRMMIVPEKDGLADWRSGVGTGGYVLQEFEAGVRTTVERNPNYWRDDRAFFDSAEVLAMPDVAARQNALMTGEIDILDQVDLKTVHLLEREDGVKVARTRGGLHYVYGMNTTVAPFDDVDVRLAFKYGVDREAMLQKVLRGYGTVGNDHPIPSTMQYFAADIAQRAYDPDRARFHLKKAGLDRLSVAMSASDGAYVGCVDGAVIYKEALAPIGIELEIVREPTDGYWSSVWLKKPFVASYWSPRPTPDIMFSSAYYSQAPWNETKWSNARFDALLEDARAELDEDRRAEIYRDMQMMVHDDGGAIIPAFADSVFALSDKIGHPEAMAGNWELDGGRSLERWWFAS